MIKYILQFLIFLSSVISLSSVCALPRQGGELGNGRSVSYPIIGIRTVRPNSWGDFESIGSVRLFRPQANETQAESVVVFESVTRGGIENLQDLAEFTRRRFSPNDAVAKLTFTRSDKLQFAFLPEDAGRLKGCAWMLESKSQVCFTTQSPKGYEASIQTILENLEIIN